jgi:uncharacterized protein (DUF697 family)/predicted transcriptional regulator
MLGRVQKWWTKKRAADEAELQKRLDDLRQHSPAPVFWLFGKTQSGKTSLIKFLTGAADAEIGHGFQPCTRFSRIYEFPTADAPIFRFLDTRGVDEPGYEPTVDLEKFGKQAHVIIVTVKALDHAQENVRRHLKVIRKSKPDRPILLVLSCLHEAYPQQQHPTPYPFRLFAAGETIAPSDGANVPTDLTRTLEEQRRRFAEIADYVAPLDLTRSEEGFADPNYGGEILYEALLKVLPDAQRQTFEAYELASKNIHEAHARKMMPTIVGYSAMAASAGAIPVPFVSLLVLPGIQKRMVKKLAEQTGRPESATAFLDTAQKLGLGKIRRQMAVEALKIVPYIGAISSAAAAGESTYALGKAFAHFDSTLSHGMSLDANELQRYYQEQLDRARTVWKRPQPTDQSRLSTS